MALLGWTGGPRGKTIGKGGGKLLFRGRRREEPESGGHCTRRKRVAEEFGDVGSTSEGVTYCGIRKGGRPRSVSLA
jgi:hypothetical protein